MWIKTIDGLFFNTDHVITFMYDEDSNTTDARLDSGDVYELCEGDHVREIIQNIISGTKLMEVQ